MKSRKDVSGSPESRGIGLSEVAVSEHIVGCHRDRRKLKSAGGGRRGLVARLAECLRESV